MTVFQGEKLRQVREAKDLSQEELALKAGLGSQSAIARLEKGSTRKPHSKTIQRLASALGCSPSEFQGEAPECRVSPIWGVLFFKYSNGIATEAEKNQLFQLAAMDMQRGAGSVDLCGTPATKDALQSSTPLPEMCPVTHSAEFQRWLSAARTMEVPPHGGIASIC